jgi:catechol 2,3-dioxygenase-like lactoylglutathione lyase family enzyme
MSATSEPFQFKGINHLALVCSDMARTVDFYTNVLDMPLTKTLEIPGGGQHFFFDCGSGDQIAFFWFPNAPAHAPGVASAAAMPGAGDIATAHGSMNHVAFDVTPENFERYVERLRDRGVEVTPIINHDDSESTVSMEMHPGVFIRSAYFRDPDGILLEFACWTRELGPDDVRHAPADAQGRRAELTATP